MDSTRYHLAQTESWAAKSISHYLWKNILSVYEHKKGKNNKKLTSQDKQANKSEKKKKTHLSCWDLHCIIIHQPFFSFTPWKCLNHFTCFASRQIGWLKIDAEDNYTKLRIRPVELSYSIGPFETLLDFRFFILCSFVDQKGKKNDFCISNVFFS